MSCPKDWTPPATAGSRNGVAGSGNAAWWVPKVQRAHPWLDAWCLPSGVPAGEAAVLLAVSRAAVVQRTSSGSKGAAGFALESNGHSALSAMPAIAIHAAYLLVSCLLTACFLAQIVAMSNRRRTAVDVIDV